MGLFSRLVLGFPILLQSSSATVQGTTPCHQFPDGGARTSLRFMPVPRHKQKRRRFLMNGETSDVEITVYEIACESPNLEFIGEVIDQEDFPHIEKSFPYVYS